MFQMDGRPWAMGIPDDSSPYLDAKSPQFSLAFAVTEGEHEVSIGEWEWPELPPMPERRKIE